MADTSNLDAVLDTYARQCGAHDYGLVEYGCQCGPDPRPVLVDLVCELEKARAAIARVRALHEPMETDRYPVCFHCIGNEPWPCPTIRALEGDE